MTIFLDYNFFSVNTFLEYCGELFNVKNFPEITFNDVNELSNLKNKSDFIISLRALFNTHIECVDITNLDTLLINVQFSGGVVRSWEFKNKLFSTDIHNLKILYEIENDYYQKCVRFVNFINNVIIPIIKKNNYSYLNIDGYRIWEITELLNKNIITFPVAKIIANKILSDDLSPQEIIDRLGLTKIKDEKILLPFIETAMEQHKDFVHDYIANKNKKSLGLIISSILKKTNNKGDVSSIIQLINNKLKSAKSS